MVGRLIYLIGPSGSGKDSLLEAARGPLAERGCRIVRRVITRSAEAVGEAAQGVSPAQFAALQAEGGFALSWHANGLSYGIPRQIDDRLRLGNRFRHRRGCRQPPSRWWSRTASTSAARRRAR